MSPAKIVLFVALVFCAASLSAANDEVATTPCKLESHPEAHICTEESRKPKMCPRYITMNGCHCYKDGTCKNSAANSCSDCANEDIVSVMEGKDCKCADIDTQVVTSEQDQVPVTNPPCKLKSYPEAHICTEESRKPRVCPMYILATGCHCYKDGTCKHAATNKCTDCANEEIVSVMEGKECQCE
mmetsp:Transcript_27715/g.31971  ORF Transcript_27715/g.31971 Transcript_27715/m.31971 type:complete len:185 (-) Transcript_27715:150-704(-)